MIAVTPLAATGQRQDDEIVVTARKLRDWRAVLVAGSGDALACRIVRSTGDAALDAMACRAQTHCFESARPRIADATSKPAPIRKRLMAAINRDIETCFATVSRRFAIYPTDSVQAMEGTDPAR